MTDPEPTPTPTPEPTPDPTPTPTPEPSPGKWMEDLGFDTDLRSNPTLNKYQTAEAQARAHIELQKALGKDRIAVPGAESGDDEWNAFYAKAGRPEDVNGYNLSEWQPPEGVPWDADGTKHMIERMHHYGLSTKQAQGILNDFAQRQAETWEQMQETTEKAIKTDMAALDSEWGSASPVKRDLAKRLSIKYGGVPSEENPNLFDRKILADGRAIGDDPEIIKMMAQIAEDMGITEDGSAGLGARRTTKTPDEARRELSEMLGDPVKMRILTDITHPEHKALQERKTDLERQVYTT